MAETMPRKTYQSPRKQPNRQQLTSSSPFSSTVSMTPKTPQTSVPTALRRSSRRIALSQDLTSPEKPFSSLENSVKVSPQSSKLAGNGERLNPRTPKKMGKDLVETRRTPKGGKNVEDTETLKRKLKDGLHSVEVLFSPVSPELSDTKKRKRKDCREERNANSVMTRSKVKTRSGKVENLKKRRVYYKKVVYDGGEFEVGDDVYVKRRENVSSDEEEPELEDCRICFKAGRSTMIECEDCLGGFHLKCSKPPLKEVPEGEWICEFCEARKLGKQIELPKPPEGKKIFRTMREKLLSSDLWAAHIERFGLILVLN